MKNSYYLLHTREKKDTIDYEGIFIGLFHNDEEALTYAKKRYQVKADTKLVKLVAFTEYNLTLAKEDSNG